MAAGQHLISDFLPPTCSRSSRNPQHPGDYSPIGDEVSKDNLYLAEYVLPAHSNPNICTYSLCIAFLLAHISAPIVSYA
ncbi:hypothetical protein ACTXT7_007871 [Hymenolepis weldensis]